MLFTFKSERGIEGINLDKLLTFVYHEKMKILALLVDAEMSMEHEQRAKNGKTEIMKKREYYQLLVTDPGDITKFFTEIGGAHKPTFELPTAPPPTLTAKEEVEFKEEVS